MNAWKDEARVQHFACLALSNFAHEDSNKVAIGAPADRGHVKHIRSCLFPERLHKDIDHKEYKRKDINRYMINVDIYIYINPNR